LFILKEQIMALIDTMLNLLNKKAKDPDAPKPPAGSRSEREAKIKDNTIQMTKELNEIEQ
jgi:hypothetical protein